MRFGLGERIEELRSLSFRVGGIDSRRLLGDFYGGCSGGGVFFAVIGQVKRYALGRGFGVFFVRGGRRARSAHGHGAVLLWVCDHTQR